MHGEEQSRSNCVCGRSRPSTKQLPPPSLGRTTIVPFCAFHESSGDEQAEARALRYPTARMCRSKTRSRTDAGTPGPPGPRRGGRRRPRSSQRLTSTAEPRACRYTLVKRASSTCAVLSALARDLESHGAPSTGRRGHPPRAQVITGVMASWRSRAGRSRGSSTEEGQQPADLRHQPGRQLIDLLGRQRPGGGSGPRCHGLDSEDRGSGLVAHLGLAHKTAATGAAGDRGELRSAPLGPAVAARRVASASSDAPSCRSLPHARPCAPRGPCGPSRAAGAPSPLSG